MSRPSEPTGPPQRPPPGTAGAPYRAVTNCFVIERLNPRAMIHQYHVFKPDIPVEDPNDTVSKAQLLRKRIACIDNLQANIQPDLFQPRAGYDGNANIFAVRKLSIPKGDMGTYEVWARPGPPPRTHVGRYSVTITHVADVNMDRILTGAREADEISYMPITVLNVLLRMAPSLSDYPSNARSFFIHEAGNREGPLGIRLIAGFYQSVRPSWNRLLVNVDTTVGLFYPRGSLTEAIQKFSGERDLRRALSLRGNTREFKRLQMFLKGLVVHATHKSYSDGRSFVIKIKGLIENVGAYEFERDGVPTTVGDYFRAMYNKKIQPGEVGIDSRKGVFPVEVLEIVKDQMIPKNFAMSGDVVSAIQAFTNEKPERRLKSILRAGNFLQYNTSQFLRQAGVSVNLDPIRVPGRILNVVPIRFAHRQANPKDGRWNVLGQQLEKPESINCWGLITFDGRVKLNTLQNFAIKFMEACNTLGITATRRPIIHEKDPNGSIHDSLDKLATEVAAAAGSPGKPWLTSLIVVVLVNPMNEVRHRVKHWSHVSRGVPVQIVVGAKEGFQTVNNQYINNVVLKVNAKLGGWTSIPGGHYGQWMSEEDTMVIGADVGHGGAGPSSTAMPSIAGLVASMDKLGCFYVGKTSLQKAKQEIIADLEGMFEAVLKTYRSYGRHFLKRETLPQRILFYRDGISEGEYMAVAKEEVKALKKVLAKIGLSTRITYIIVTKKHHIRFFPAQGAQPSKSGNCPAGFVSDDAVANPLYFDFYLQSTAGLKGTSRPSHYIVAHDENHLNSDALQGLSWSLCHAYARATTSVSIPAPVYYADLLCTQGKFQYDPEFDVSETASFADGGGPRLEYCQTRFLKVHDNSQTKMYFV